MRHGILMAMLFSLAGPGCERVAAQEIVHALSGTFQKVNAQAKTIQVATNDGSEGTFRFPPVTSKTRVDFERDVQDRATPVRSFSKPNAHVIVFYYGDGSVRTAVGVQDLGPGPFDTVEGMVTKFDSHHHRLTVRDSSGKEHTFQIGMKAMADGPVGALPANRLSVSKGDNVRVVATDTAGSETALFIRDS